MARRRQGCMPLRPEIRGGRVVGRGSLILVRRHDSSRGPLERAPDWRSQQASEAHSAGQNLLFGAKTVKAVVAAAGVVPDGDPACRLAT
eukprot:5108407-Alexandrium_andersonii.AAC.1